MAQDDSLPKTACLGLYIVLILTAAATVAVLVVVDEEDRATQGRTGHSSRIAYDIRDPSDY